jgi:T5orf172 domain
MNPEHAEKLVHSALAEFRVRGDREFFAVEVAEAGRRISRVLDNAGLSLRTLENPASLAS